MGPLSSATTPNSTIVTPFNRDTAQVKDDSASFERLQTTKPLGSSVAKSENGQEKNYKSQVLAESPLPSASVLSGNRRGSLLDLTV